MARILTSEIATAIQLGVSLGVGLSRQGEQTSSANTANLTETARSNWVDSIVGAFDDNPVYVRIMENVKENRRRLEEQFTSE